MIAFADASRRPVDRTVAMTQQLFAQLRETTAEARESRRSSKRSCCAAIASHRKTTTTFRSCAEIILRRKAKENVS
ncbi:MAG TPA: hypothetical protein VH934_05750 [Xanthobacteraceae bacterium]